MRLPRRVPEAAAGFGHAGQRRGLHACGQAVRTAHVNFGSCETTKRKMRHGRSSLPWKRGGAGPSHAASPSFCPPHPKTKHARCSGTVSPLRAVGVRHSTQGAPPTRRAMTIRECSAHGPVRYGGGATAGHLRGDVNLCDRRAHPARVEVVGELLEQRVVVRGSILSFGWVLSRTSRFGGSSATSCARAQTRTHRNTKETHEHTNTHTHARAYTHTHTHTHAHAHTRTRTHKERAHICREAVLLRPLSLCVCLCVCLLRASLRARLS